jgi:hypothetical protein
MVEIHDEAVSGGCLNINQSWFIRTYTVTDACGNASMFEQQVHLTDNVAPEVVLESCPMDVTLTLDALCSVDISVEALGMAVGSATDNCDMPEVIVTYADGESESSCGAGYEFTRTFFVSAADGCGNTSVVLTCDQVITVVDTTAPDMVASEDATVECDGAGNVSELEAWLASNGGASATDVCGAVTWTNDFVSLGAACGATGAATVIFTATDDCGNATSTAATFTVQDTTAPEIMAGSDATVECDGLGNVADLNGWLASNGGASASDMCGGVVWSNDFVEMSDACGATGAASVTFTATDDCGNATSTAATFTILDTTSPDVVAAADTTVECDGAGNTSELEGWLASNGGASAMDACSGVTWTNDFELLSGGCASTAAVTFTATDDCGNATSTTASFTVVDTSAPSFTEMPSDQNSQCEEQSYTSEASDGCGGVTISESRAVVSEDECGGYEHLVTLTATDACGNSAEHQFSIVVADTEGPDVVDSEGVEDGGVVPVCGEDVWGGVTIPAAITISAADNCGGDVEVSMVETILGDYAPTDQVDVFCMPLTPAPVDLLETCDLWAPHSMRLLNFIGDEFYTTLGGLVSNYADGTVHISMEVVSSDNPNAGWIIEADFGENMTWAEWDGQPGDQGYKNECGIGDHTTWMYSILQSSSSASGWGDYAGSEFTLSHQPASEFFGFQMGVGANNKNANQGFSGWFQFEGSFQGEYMIGFGDLFGDMDCFLPWEIERTYSMVDCNGNETSYTYSVDVNGVTCEPFSPTLADNEEDEDNGGSDTDTDANISDEGGKLKILGLTPNPSSELAMLTFISSQDERVQVNLYNTTGILVATFFNSTVHADVAITIEIPSNTIENGLYQVQVLSRSDMVTSKLMIAH